MQLGRFNIRFRKYEDVRWSIIETSTSVMVNFWRYGIVYRWIPKGK